MASGGKPVRIAARVSTDLKTSAFRAMRFRSRLVELPDKCLDHPGRLARWSVPVMDSQTRKQDSQSRSKRHPPNQTMATRRSFYP